MIFIDEQKFKNFSGIYCIRQISKELYYIGQTSMPFAKRFWNHRWKLNDNSHDNKHLQNSWNKYGENDFEFKVLYILKDGDDIDQIEIQYIEKYDSYKNGFNMTTGGDGKRNCPMSENAKKIVGEKNRIHNLGKKASEETKEKMRNSSRHKTPSKENLQKLRESRIGSKWDEGFKQKMRERQTGSNNAVAVINEKIAFEIKIKLMNHNKRTDIAKEFNIDYAVVKSILENKTWKHVYVDGWEDFVREYNKNKQKLLLDEQVREIRCYLEQGLTANKISVICNVGCSVVYAIKQNRTYKNVI